MIDTKSVPILSLVTTPMKKAAGTGGGEYHGPCPFCGGKDRFIVQPANNRWSCRQCSQKWGDAISYVMARDGVGFKEACQTLNVGLPERRQQPRRAIAPQPPVQAGGLREDYACFDDSWQASAEAFTDECFDLLWSSEGERARQYLESRHLNKPVMGAAGLGYNPVNRNAKWGKVDVWLPRGIVIPWQFDGQTWKVNIRRPTLDIKSEKDKRYIQAAGGANGLYGAHVINNGCYVIMTEGEFDVLVMRSVLRRSERYREVVFIGTGSAEGARLLRWVGLLAAAEQILLAFDADDAGDKAAQWWSMALPKKTRRLRPEGAKDITDMVKGGVNLVAWLDTVL
jgi:DNA primase